MITPHVEQRHLTDDGAKQVRPQRQHIAHQQATIGAALYAQMRCAGDLAFDELFGDCDEVFIGMMPILLQCSLVPGRAKLATTADVGNDKNAALLQPGLANGGAVIRHHRYFKTAVAVQQRRVAAIALHIHARNLKIRNVRSIL